MGDSLQFYYQRSYKSANVSPLGVSKVLDGTSKVAIGNPNVSGLNLLFTLVGSNPVTSLTQS